MTAYGTDTGFQEYAVARGLSEVTAAGVTVEQRNEARLRGSEFIDGRFRSVFPGLPADGRAQDREWPRIGAADARGYAIAADETPTEVEHASYEAAVRELVAPGSLLPDVTPSEQVKRTSEQIGPIREEIEYVTASSADASRPDIAIIDAIMARLIGTTRPDFLGSSGRA